MLEGVETALKQIIGQFIEDEVKRHVETIGLTHKMTFEQFEKFIREIN